MWAWDMPDSVQAAKGRGRLGLEAAFPLERPAQGGHALGSPLTVRCPACVQLFHRRPPVLAWWLAQPGSRLAATTAPPSRRLDTGWAMPCGLATHPQPPQARLCSGCHRRGRTPGPAAPAPCTGWPRSGRCCWASAARPAAPPAAPQAWVTRTRQAHQAGPASTGAAGRPLHCCPGTQSLPVCCSRVVASPQAAGRQLL